MVVERTVAELNGVSCLALEGVAPDKQQIIASRSFGELVTDLVGIAPRRPCCGEATPAAQRRADGRGQLRTNPFREGDGQYKGWIVVLLVHPSCDSITITSTALAGLRTIFRPGYRKQLGLSNFGAINQDRIALQLIRECRALDDIQRGNIADAISKCRSRWASLPGAGYGQNEHRAEALLAAYAMAGGRLA